MIHDAMFHMVTRPESQSTRKVVAIYSFLVMCFYTFVEMFWSKENHPVWLILRIKLENKLHLSTFSTPVLSKKLLSVNISPQVLAPTLDLEKEAEQNKTISLSMDPNKHRLLWPKKARIKDLCGEEPNSKMAARMGSLPPRICFKNGPAL